MKKLIRVTQEHIDRGQARNPTACPVAKALAGNGLFDVEVYPNRMEFYHPPYGLYLVEAPDSVKRFVMDFDNKTKNPKPFNFYLIY